MTIDTRTITITGPLTDDELCAIAEDGVVAVNVTYDFARARPGAVHCDEHPDFGAYLGERITGHAIPGITYWQAAPYSDTYSVCFELGPDVYLRQARKVIGGRARHGQVKHARDRRRAVLKQEAHAITVDLNIHNQYERYADITSYVYHARIPAPPCEHDWVAYDAWAHTQLYDRTGTGRPDGDSWYQGVITRASDRALIGRVF